MKRFLQSGSFKTLVAITVVVLLGVLCAAISRNASSPVTTAIGTVFSPLQRLSAYIADNLNDVEASFESSIIYRAENAELEKQIPLLPREEIARCSIDTNGKIIVTDNLVEAMNVSNILAPEHLEICVDNPFEYLGYVKNAGSVFLGKNCPEALGDYFAGPNHTLPTSGTARFSSPLSVDDFVKKTQFSYFSREALKEVSDKVVRFATEEGLHAHAKSVSIRTENQD